MNYQVLLDVKNVWGNQWHPSYKNYPPNNKAQKDSCLPENDVLLGK